MLQRPWSPDESGSEAQTENDENIYDDQFSHFEKKLSLRFFFRRSKFDLGQKSFFLSRDFFESSFFLSELT